MLDITCHPMPILATREACVSLLPQELPGWNLELAAAHRGQRKTEEGDRPLETGKWLAWYARELTCWGLSWVSTRQVDLCTHPLECWSWYRGLNWDQWPTQGALTEFSRVSSPGSLRTTSRSQGCTLGAASESEVRQSLHSKDRGAGGELPGSSPHVSFSWWPPP